MKLDLDKMDTYKFVVCVLIFVLIFTVIFTMQMRSVVNLQSKILMEFLEGAKPKVTTSTTYTTPTPSTKYTGY